MKVESPELSYRGRGTYLALRIRNDSAIGFRLRIRQAPAWSYLDTKLIPAGTSVLFPGISRDAPEGTHRFELELELTNLHTGPGRNLVVRVPLSVNVARQ